jgi:hypothetical protein
LYKNKEGFSRIFGSVREYGTSYRIPRARTGKGKNGKSTKDIKNLMSNAGKCREESQAMQKKHGWAAVNGKKQMWFIADS